MTPPSFSSFISLLTNFIMQIFSLYQYFKNHNIMIETLKTNFKLKQQNIKPQTNIREVIIDTETTGLNPKKDRIIEIAAVELINKQITGKQYHSYFNPEPVQVSTEAFKIHNISNEFLKTKPKFAQEVNKLLKFINNDVIIAHNARFDIEMINSELEKLNLTINKSNIIDSLELARKLFPGKSNKLQTLAKRYKLTTEKAHSAINDCKLLAKLYIMITQELHPKINYNTTLNNKLKTTNIKLKKQEIIAHNILKKQIPNSIWELYHDKRSF